MSVDLSPRGRAANLARMQEEVWDLAVVGGGIVGAGIARDAAMRGMRTVLVEKGDFASGTSGKTSRLVHGGLRYLARGKIGLVRQAVRERDLLLEQAPALVRPLAFTLPAYRGKGSGPLALRFGLWMYDRLSRRNALPRREWVPPEAAHAREPGLSEKGLRGAGIYHDARTEDARLVLAVVRDAAAKGAVVANYAEVTGLRRTDGRITGAVVRDRMGQTDFEIRAQTVVNATGVWLDGLRLGSGGTIRATKGVHVFLPRDRVGNRGAVTLTSPRDGRVLFVLPWGDLTLVGTTDTDYAGDPDRVLPAADDVAYLLESVNEAFPGARAGPADVVSLYAGLRPLIAAGGREKESDISRAHEIFRDPDGLISVAGGKLTTQRAMAEETVDLVATRLGRPAPCRTRGASFGPPSAAPGAFRRLGFPEDVAAFLGARYDPVDAEPWFAEPDARRRIFEDGPHVWGEIDIAAGTEMAMTLEDALVRRLGLFYERRDLGRSVAGPAAERMARHLGWPKDRVEAEVTAYESLVTAHLAFREDHGR